jgi:hypothetical protein
MGREVPAESNGDRMRRLEREEALRRFHAGKLRSPSEARLAEPDVHGQPQATHPGWDAIVEYEDEDGVWQLARVNWETYQAIVAAVG